jgi:outer membrane protein assembly factor BamB
MKSYVILIALSLLLNGCTWISDYLGGDDNIEPPKELVELKNAIDIEKIWSVSTGDGSGEQLLHLTPAVEAGRVFVATLDGHLTAYKIDDGEQIWDMETSQKLTAGPGVGSGLVLAGTRSAEVIAHRADDGTAVWTTKLSSEVLSVPEIRKDIAIIRTSDGRVTALNLEDGKKLWDFYKKEPSLTLRGTSKPLIVEDSVISGFDNGLLVAMSLSDGRQQWQKRVAVARGRTELERVVDLDADPVFSDGIVYAAAFQANIAAINLIDGQLIWQRELSSHAGMAVSDSQLYITDSTSQVWALHVRNGASLWRQDKLQYRSLTAPVVFGDYVVVGDFEGYLHWLKQDNGEVVARMRGDSDGFSVRPVVAGDILIALGKDGEMNAFKLSVAK